jgi:predicted permease
MSQTFLIILILCLAAWNGLRMSEAIFFWNSLEEYGAHPLYILMSGVTWLLIGLILGWSLWKGKNRGRIITLSIAVSYSTWYWLDRIVLQKPHANWLFSLIVNIALLLIIFFIMFSQKMRYYFKKDSDERKSKTTNP